MHKYAVAFVLLCATALGARAQATADLIVQFREPVLAAGSKRMSAQAMAARRGALNERLTDFRRDFPALRNERTFHRVLFGVSVRVPAELRKSIEKLPYVASVHDNGMYLPTWDESLNLIRAPKVWEQFGTRGAGVRIAIIDSGIDYRHHALGGGIGAGFKVAGGWDFVDNDADPLDTFGHGTHVAGIAAGKDGVFRGVAPDATLLAYRAIRDETGGTIANVIAAIERAVDPDDNDDPSDHADIINMSLGGSPHPDDPGITAVENATAAGVLVVIASGNTSIFGDVQAPGLSPSALTVGAADFRDRIAPFSSRGPSLFYALKPEVVAPGVGVVSSFPDDRYAVLSGTSMAAPQVAGVAALMKAVHKNWSPSELKNAIIASATRLQDDVMSVGAGRVDAVRATSLDTLVTPAVLSLGAVDATQATWSVSRTVTLRNTSSAPQTLTASVAGLRDGISVTVTPAAVTIAAGASASVQVDLAVQNAIVPAPQEGSLSYGGAIEWSGGAVPVHAAWSFVKGKFLKIALADWQTESFATILGAQRRHVTGRFFGSTRVFWPLEKIDVVVVEAPRSLQPVPERIVAVEQIDTTSASEVTVPMAEAKFTIATTASDPAGAPLVNAARWCKDQFVFAFPSGRKFSRDQAPNAPLQFSRFSDRVELHIATHCVEPSMERMYSALLDGNRGLNGHMVKTVHGPWVQHDFTFPGDSSTFARLVYPSIRVPGNESSWFLAPGWGIALNGPPRALTIYSAGGSIAGADLVTSIAQAPFGSLCTKFVVGGPEPCRGDTPFIYLDDAEARIDGDLYLDVSPMAYRVPAGSTARFAPGPFWANLQLFFREETFEASSSWHGPLNERRFLPAATITVRNAAGEVVARSGSDGYLYRGTPLSPGAYRAEAVQAGQRKSTISASFDTRREDHFIPQLTGLRIVDAQQQQTDSVAGGAGASLLFSIADEVDGAWSPTRKPPVESATRVDYSPHGANDWRPLSPSVEARQYVDATAFMAGVGTMYRVDLSTVTGSVSGAVDLRVHAEDAAGNVVEMVLESALTVGSTPAPPRRRAVRH